MLIIRQNKMEELLTNSIMYIEFSFAGEKIRIVREIAKTDRFAINFGCAGVIENGPTGKRSLGRPQLMREEHNLGSGNTTERSFGERRIGERFFIQP